MLMIRSLLLATIALVTAPALAQTTPEAPPAGQIPPPLEVSVTGGVSAPMPIAIPPMATPAVVATAAKSTDVMGRELAEMRAAAAAHHGGNGGSGRRAVLPVLQGA